MNGIPQLPVETVAAVECVRQVAGRRNAVGVRIAEMPDRLNPETGRHLCLLVVVLVNSRGSGTGI